MFLRYFILACVVSCVVTQSIYENFENYSGPPVNELPCIVIGGSCQEVGKCPDGTRVTTKGMCPYQEKRGIQCCHSAKAKPVAKQATCRSKGGECFKFGTQCPDYLTMRAVSDCQPDETCCVLVK